MITQFCQDANIKPQIGHGQAIWPSGKYEDYHIHCFADPAAAKAFLDHFGGEMFDPKRDREGGKSAVSGVARANTNASSTLDL
ncbi:hypothetical protein LB545_28845 [Mesorhizobium sp. BR1-1-6]|uniref:hypothetical protein n=1 Tax=Mesorhizobium sp. BR1-1-6 TaxID=2876648 RepID=UPI001CD0A726|nr:hypothetical protein [Mesorhizobium sp. BR1-1-6]MBZ9898323.1 hypothetical protein [Mesorhizobium sp. BR1-1-6]